MNCLWNLTRGQLHFLLNLVSVNIIPSGVKITCKLDFSHLRRILKCCWLLRSVCGHHQAVATVTQLNGFKGKLILDNSNGQVKAVDMLGTFTSSGVGRGEVGLLSVKGHVIEITFLKHFQDREWKAERGIPIALVTSSQGRAV